MVAKLQVDSDNDVIQQCIEGNTNAFRLLYQRHQSKVRSLLFQMCGSEALDDLVQEVFLRAWRGLKQFRRSSQFSTWLYRITWNVATDQRGAFAKRNQRESKVEMEQLLNLPENNSGSPLQTLHYQDVLYRGLAHLSFDHRTVIILHDLEELPQKEIAAMLNIPIGTVKSRLFHARSALRQYLEAQGVEL